MPTSGSLSIAPARLAPLLSALFEGLGSPFPLDEAAGERTHRVEAGPHPEIPDVLYTHRYTTRWIDGDRSVLIRSWRDEMGDGGGEVEVEGLPGGVTLQLEGDLRRVRAYRVEGPSAACEIVTQRLLELAARPR